VQPDLCGSGIVTGGEPLASGCALGHILAAFGSRLGDPYYRPEVDFDDDDVVGQIDLAIFLSSLGCSALPPEFGASVAIDAGSALCGAPSEFAQACERPGSVHGFALESGWQRTNRIRPGLSSDDLFGTAIALSGQRGAIGAVRATGDGHVIIDSEPFTSDPPPPPPAYAEVIDNSEFSFGNPIRYIDNVDLWLAVDAGADDDWTTTVLNVEVLQPGRTIWMPGIFNLSFPSVVVQDQNFDGVRDPIALHQQWKSFRSTPDDWPNVLEIGSPNSTHFLAQAAVGNNQAIAGLTWGNRGDLGYGGPANFVVFRLAIATLAQEERGLTLEFTGLPVARVSGVHTLRNTGGLPRPFEFIIYQDTCLGDLDGSGSIGQSDLGILLADYGCTDGPGNCPGDTDSDGDTDQSDLGFLLANYGGSCE
jgi:hypothetical protein